MSINSLHAVDFELAYLALLTLRGLKPLSRWELPLDDKTADILRECGLKVRSVIRLLKNGNAIKETIFSLSELCLDEYCGYFDCKPIKATEQSMWVEGILFGYPSCCVASFIRNGYVENGLSQAEQRLLFHWVCPQCLITPILLPQYRAVFEECKRIRTRQGDWYRCNEIDNAQSSRFKKLIARAASIAAISMAINGYAGGVDPHQTPLSQYEDSDADLLKDAEEAILNTNPYNPDEDNNKSLDGVDLALSLYSLVSKLSTEPTNNQPYITFYMAFGVESCNVCGEPINMGLCRITNPLENQSIDLSIIALHYMEHGSFTYSGSIHKGRVNAPLLKTIIESSGLAHFIKESSNGDKDNDGLRDYEEALFNTNPDDNDTNDNLILDGIELARQFKSRLDALPRATSPETGRKDRPFVVETSMDGIEICPRCGESVAMNIWRVYNPVNNISISISSMALHYLEHSGFCWEGGNLLGGQGRVDPAQLRAVLDGLGNGHWIKPVNDNDGDGLNDNIEQYYGFSANNIDSDNDGMADGCALARAFSDAIAQLPRTPTNNIYVIEHPMRGIVYCPICGESVNMGYIEIINQPKKLTLQLSYLDLHFLQNGGLENPLNAMPSPVDLSLVLSPSITIVKEYGSSKLRWKTQPGRRYQIFRGESIFGGWEKIGELTGDGNDVEFVEDDAPIIQTKKFYKITVY